MRGEERRGEGRSGAERRVVRNLIAWSGMHERHTHPGSLEEQKKMVQMATEVPLSGSSWASIEIHGNP